MIEQSAFKLKHIHWKSSLIWYVRMFKNCIFVHACVTIFAVPTQILLNKSCLMLIFCHAHYTHIINLETFILRKKVIICLCPWTLLCVEMQVIHSVLMWKRIAATWWEPEVTMSTPIIAIWFTIQNQVFWAWYVMLMMVK